MLHAEVFMKVSWLKKSSAILLVLLSAVIISACGRKDDPVPDFSRDSFTFKELRADMAADGTVTISGDMNGAFQNMEYMVLEMQPVDGELCAGCPFLPQDQYRVDSRDAWESENGSRFSFVYRPVFPAELYRWRLIGHNTYSGVPDVTSNVESVGPEDVLIRNGIIGKNVK